MTLLEGKHLELSALLVVGSSRKRAQRSLDALAAQTKIDSIEILVMDIAPDYRPRLVIPDNKPVVYIAMPKGSSFGRARHQALLRARAPIVAFIEDHCFATPGWADAVIRAHQGPWAAVGYAFMNANPRTYISRSTLVCDYGYWMHPANSQPATLLPCNNASYKRDQLLSFGDDLETALTPDYNVHQWMIRRGMPMYIQAEAIVAHQNYSGLRHNLTTKFNFCRMLASRRVESQGWGQLKRIAYGFATPFVAPIILMWRLYSSLPGRFVLVKTFVSALPFMAVSAISGAIGESLGYLLGPASSVAAFDHWELEVERDPTA